MIELTRGKRTFPREERRKIEIWREKIATGITAATRKRIRSDVSVRIERIFRKWQMHVITVPVRWASIAREIHAIPCHSRSVHGWRIDRYSTCRRNRANAFRAHILRLLDSWHIPISYCTIFPCVYCIHNMYVCNTSKYFAECSLVYRCYRCYCLVTMFNSANTQIVYTTLIKQY